MRDRLPRTAKACLLTLSLLGLFVLPGYSNNPTVENVQQLSQTSVSFDVSWENSWGTGSATAMHDALWIIIKYRQCGSAFNSLPFSHLLINPGGHSVTGGLQLNPIDPAPNNTGVMVRRSGAGASSGTVTLSVSFPDVVNYEVRVFALEMAYVTPGSFYVGDGAALNTLGNGNDLTQPFLITSENSPISVGPSAGSLYSAGTVVPTSTISGSYPKGVAGFYCMKTELTQQNYADFLNSLDFNQFVPRYMPGPSDTYTLQGNWPNVSTPHPARAMANLNWEDLTAYLDWAALRPMTELEFEKACRGAAAPVAGEFAWGNTTTVGVTAKINPACETASNVGAEGVCNWSDENADVGTMRVGFLGTGSSTRTTIGAGYSGVLELSGNVFEQIVTLVSDGPGYSGQLGDGVVGTSGQSNVGGWPIYPSNGHSYRGGAWFNGSVAAQTSMRWFIFLTSHDRYSNAGGRGVR